MDDCVSIIGMTFIGINKQKECAREVKQPPGI